MDFSFTPDSIANVVALVAPGYFAIQAYAIVYAKAEKDFSRLVVESIAYGLLIVSVYNFAWRLIFGDNPINALAVGYFVPLLITSWLLGAGFSFVRDTRLAHWIAKRLHFPGPDDDFIRVQFKKLPPDSLVTVTLKTGEIFSGTPEGLSTMSNKYPQRLYFSNIAWFNKDRKRSRWEVRPGSVIIASEDILYIETDLPLPKS